jgi:hypothetical protein
MGEKTLDNGWTPRDLGGGIYCSPRCGYKCKRAEFDRVTAAAAALAARMGEGWRPHVWENGGWHYYAVKGDGGHHSGLAEIHPPTRHQAGYSAWINPQTEAIGQVITEVVSDPIEALGLATQEARTRLLRFEAELNAISNEES